MRNERSEMARHPPQVEEQSLYRTVYGNFPYVDGSGRIPAVEFKPNARLSSAAGLITTQEPYRIALSTDGAFEVDLLTTDSNPLIYPSGWCWEIREDFRGGDTYWFLLPFDDGSPISISSIAPIPAKPPLIGASSGPRGKPGPRGEPGDPGKDGTFKVWRQPVRPNPVAELVAPGDLWFQMPEPPPLTEEGAP